MNEYFLGLSEVQWIALQTITAFLALVGLIAYTRLTWQLRDATAKQSEASRRPFIRVHNADQDLTQDEPVTFINDGLGPALKIRVSFLNPEPSESDFYNGAVGVGEPMFAALSETRMVIHDEVINRGVRFTYEDTAGKRYWTTIRKNQNVYISDTGDEC